MIPPDAPKAPDTGPSSADTAAGSGASVRGGPEGVASASAEPETVAAEVASDVRAAIAPVRSAMKADVGSLAVFLRSIQSGYLLAGLGLLAVTGIVGVIVTLLYGFSDWFMHLAMYVVLLSFALLYVRAHQRNYRVMRAIWAVFALALIVFFAWILIDLVPQRLDVLSGRPRPGGFTGPEVALRPHAGGLWAPIVMLGLVALWLASHWLVLSRYRALRARTDNTLGVDGAGAS